MKLWEKGYQLDPIIEAFMTGDDPKWDRLLIPYDCWGSMAHAKMLERISILTSQECSLLLHSLSEIIELAEKGEFTILPEEEDVHTAIENRLVAKLGAVGKKLHTARSRNDQVLLDLRLYSRDAILALMDALLHCIEALCHFAEKQQAVPMPGRTHFQRAMPSSMGLWAGAFAESLLDDCELLKSGYWIMDQCPLGSAASYGVNLPIDRQYVADLLGFRVVQNNVLYANNSRGKFESILMSGLVQAMNDLSKIATDIILFSAPEFGYLRLPEKFCPGSSLMPHKRNPCPFELLRAKSARVQGMFFQVVEVIRALPSGYNRDFQETKAPMMEAIATTHSSLIAFTKIFSEIEVVAEKCIAAFSSELFATDRVLSIVKGGTPFRDAYKDVALHLQEVLMEDPVQNILAKTHLGAPGNLGLSANFARMEEYRKWVEEGKSKWETITSQLREDIE